MTKLLLGLGVNLILLANSVYADAKNVRLIEEARQFEQGDKVAVVVGVEDYNQRLTGFRPLKYAADDAQQLTSTLTAKGYRVKPLINSEATKAVILNAIRQTGKTLRNGEGTLIFSFSGHGFAAGNDNYLGSFGAVAHDLQESGLSVKEVVKAIRDTGVRRAVLLLDACRNDPLPDSKSISPGFRQENPGEGIQILYSTRFQDVSWEHDDLKHGVFSYFVDQALSGKATQDGVVTFPNLADYVERQVAYWTDSHMSQTQQPFRRSDGDYYGDFVLASLGGTTALQLAPSSELEPVVTPLAPTAVQPKPEVSQSEPTNATTNLIAGRYIDHGDGTITDTKTKLMWKKCSEGQSGNTCSGKAAKYKGEEAVLRFSRNISFAGYNDWRIPVREELRTLVYCSNGASLEEIAWDHDCSENGRYQSPTINPIVFPNSLPWGYLSFSANPTEQNRPFWPIDFKSGHTAGYSRDGTEAIRLVRFSR